MDEKPGKPPPRSSVPASSTASAAAVSPILPSNGLGPVFPEDAPRPPRALKLCAALHGVAGLRRATCCGGDVSAPLLEPCERAVSASLSARSVSLDDAAIERCRAAAAARFEGCDWITPSLPALPAECQGLLRGQLSDGSVCRSSLECAGRSHCAGLTATRTGICTPPRALGAACGSHVDPMAAYVLERDLEATHPPCADFCSLTTHRCEPVPQEGAACFSSVNCAPGQHCTARRCSAERRERAPRENPGAPCTTDFDCAIGGCVPRDDGTKTCGMKCIAPLEALTSPAPAKTLELPSRATRR